MSSLVFWGLLGRVDGEVPKIEYKTVSLWLLENLYKESNWRYVNPTHRTTTRTDDFNKQ